MIKVIDTCPADRHITTSGAHRVASELDLDLCSVAEFRQKAAVDQEDYKLIFVADRDAEVERLVTGLRRAPAIRAVVAWHLSEQSVALLMRQSIPVFVGIPDRAQVETELTDGVREAQRQKERRTNAQLITLESQLMTAGPPAPGAA